MTIRIIISVKNKSKHFQNWVLFFFFYVCNKYYTPIGYFSINYFTTNVFNIRGNY